MHKITALTATAAAVALAGTAAMASPALADGPGHIVLKGNTVAVATTGKIGSTVYLARYRASNHAEDWNMNNFANAYGAGTFFYAPGGKQTNDYLAVTARGAHLVSGANHGTIFDPVAAGKYTVLAIPGKNGAPSRTVLTDSHGRLVIAAEGRHGPSSDQKWSGIR